MAVWTVRTGCSWSLLLGRGPDNPQGRNGPTNIQAHQALEAQMDFPTLQLDTVSEGELLYVPKKGT